MTQIGFTGTREGMTDSQLIHIFAQLVVCRQNDIKVMHNGLADGADFQAYVMWNNVLACQVHGHPAVGHHPLPSCHKMEAPMLPLDRNHDIVDMCGLLLATPRGMQEEQRSGTWATIRYARKVGRHTHIIWPDGTMT